MELYTTEFYRDRHEATAHSAQVILGILFEHFPNIGSAADIGCGVGTWLRTLEERGVKNILGIDGEWVDKDLLVIPRNTFLKANLTEKLRVPNRYDLAISLEVAEHLPPENARGFVQSLTLLADIVLFSAAIPLQGGVGHQNEQWQSYWASLFAEFGYSCRDLIRARIWDDAGIPFWYKQNALVFVAQSAMELTRNTTLVGQPLPLDLVHPQLLLTASEHWRHSMVEMKSLRGAIRTLGQSIYGYFLHGGIRLT